MKPRRLHCFLFGHHTERVSIDQNQDYEDRVIFSPDPAGGFTACQWCQRVWPTRRPAS